MKLYSFFITLDCFVVTGASLRPPNLPERPPEGQLGVAEIMNADQEWQNFKQTFHKIYLGLYQEWMSHLEFRQNLREIAVHNALFWRDEETYKKGLNQFSDRSARELIARARSHTDFAHERAIVPTFISDEDIPVSHDFRSVPGFHQDGVFHSFQRGWIYASLDVLQSQILLKTGRNFVLSAQEIMDCLVEFGYIKGSVVHVFSYVRDLGISSNNNYPSTSVKNVCAKPLRRPIRINIVRIHRSVPDDEENLQRFVGVIGPVAANIHVTDNFISYSSGIFYDENCHKDRLTNHVVAVVGYGTYSEGQDYWIIRNSWGPQWGENGYMRLARNTVYNCGIASAAFFPELNFDG